LKTKKKFHDPYAEILGKFNHGGIKYVVIGMSGINYYALKAQETFATQDFDIFVNPTIDNVKKCITIFRNLNYSLTANNQNLNDSSIKDIVRNKKTILAVDTYGITFELILAVSGYTFSQMEKDAAIFAVENISIKVGKLNKLLLSKKIAGREKDKLFLKRFEALLREKDNK